MTSEDFHRWQFRVAHEIELEDQRMFGHCRKHQENPPEEHDKNLQRPSEGVYTLMDMRERMLSNITPA